MNRLLRFTSQNGMSFRDLDINLDQPGLNLIMGENLDDVSGNSSRNGCGKSNVFTLINNHLFERGLDLVNQRSKRGIINTEVNSDYMSTCTWIPSNFNEGEFLTSYQYQKYQTWGSGAYLIKNGSWEDFEAGLAGTEDLSQWKSTDTQNSFQDYLNLSWQEWNLLVNLTNVDDDKDDPFFTNRDKIQRLEIFQTLFKLDYSAAHAEVKSRISYLKKQLDKNSTAIESALSVLNSQLQDLDSADNLQLKIDSATKQVTSLEEAIKVLSAKLESTESNTKLIAEFDELKTYLISSGVTEAQFSKDDNSIQSDYDTCKANLQTYLNQLSDFRVYLNQLSKYEAEVNELAHLEASSSYYLESGFTLEGIRSELADNDFKIKQQYYYQQLTGKYSWLLKYPNIQEAATELLQNYKGILADITSKLEALNAEKIAFQKQLADATLIIERTIPTCHQQHVKLKEAKRKLGELSEFNAPDDIDQRVSDLSSQLMNLALEVQKNSQNQKDIKHQLEHLDSGICPTCNQKLPTFSTSEEGKRTLSEELSKAVQLGEELTQQYSNVQSLKQEAVTIQANKRQIDSLKSELNNAIENIKASLNLETLPEDLDGYLEELKSVNEVTFRSLSREIFRVEATQSELSLQHQELSSIQEEDFKFISSHVAQNIRELELRNQELGSISQILVSLDQKRASVATHKVEVQTLLDQNFTSDYLKSAISETSTYIEQVRAYITWVEAILPYLIRIKDSKFDNVETIRWMNEGADTYEDDIRSLQLLESRLKDNQVELSQSQYQLQQRIDIEARIKQQELQNEELLQDKKRLKALQALETLCGPNGLVYSRLEVIFDHINVIMNNYMSILIPEGMKINKRVTTYFEMTSNGPIQTVYRGDNPVVKLSRSEKARVKLARTLAFREFCLPYKQCNILLLDELDGSSCDTNKERIWECVQMHLSRYPNTSVWAVSHSPEMQSSSFWDRVFRVTKKDSFSYMEQVK